MHKQKIDENKRILVIDDNEAIHKDFKAILDSRSDTVDAIMAEKEEALFGSAKKRPEMSFEVDSAYQGKEALEKVQKALTRGQPYAMAFVDIRMPPGWNGIKTIEEIWRVDPDIQVAICSAYSDYSWNDITDRLGNKDNLLILKKPFDNAEVSQIACAMTKKWSLGKQTELDMNGLEQLVQEKTRELKETNRQLQQEVTGHRKVEEILKHEKDKVQKYLDIVGVMVIVLDSNQKVRLINNKGCKIIGYEEKDVLDKDWCSNFIPEQIRDSVRAVLSALLEEKIEQFEYYENPVLNKDGEQRLIAWHNTILYNEEGQIEAILSSGEDITEHKQAEDAKNLAYTKLKKANEELKQVQSQMVQSEKLASIGQLAAGVAHEMNTPVGFVASNFQTLEGYIKKIRELLEIYNELTTKIEPAKKTELLNKANLINKFRDDKKIDFILEDIQDLFDDSKEGMERITSIIQNLRDFSRIDQPDSLDEYDLNKGIETTLVVARNEIKYDADIETDFSEIPAVFCNSGQINQVFLNVLVNAIQAIKSLERDKKGIITIKTYSTDEHVVCEICDDGPGIPPDKLSKVFDPFFTTKPVGKGTGLGLSVSYDIIVHKHNGEIFADSTLGKGSKFTIKLPIKRENQNGKKELETNEKENSVICG